MLKIVPRQFNICLYYAKCPICISFFCNNRRIKGSHLCNFSWLPPLQTWPNVPKTIQEQQILGKVEYSKAKNILLINSNLSIFHIKFQKNLNKISRLLWHIFSILCSIIFPIMGLVLWSSEVDQMPSDIWLSEGIWHHTSNLLSKIW